MGHNETSLFSDLWVIDRDKAMGSVSIPLDAMNIVNEYAGTKINIDTSRPFTVELNSISMRGFNLLRNSSSIINHLEKARIEREERVLMKLSCNQRAVVTYKRPAI